MEPTGAKRPKVYVLGEAPGRIEDEENEQFVGASGELLRTRVPREWRDKIRWNNVVRTRPRDKEGRNREPTDVEIACCRKSVESDIAASKPLAIFGFGAVTLKWVAERDGITLWRGRRFPVNVGGHECWYYPMLHPAYILHQEGEKRGYAEQLKEVFALDLKRAFAEVDSLPEAVVHTREVAEHGIGIVTGKKSGDLERLAKLLVWAKKLKVKGFDWETNALRPYAVPGFTRGLTTVESASPVSPPSRNRRTVDAYGTTASAPRFSAIPSRCVSGTGSSPPDVSNGRPNGSRRCMPATAERPAGGRSSTPS